MPTDRTDEPRIVLRALLSLFSRNITQHPRPRRLRNNKTIEGDQYVVVRVEEEKKRVNEAVS
eukprot:scaffold132440_cov66-Attheya_sp.AAC.4